MGAALFYAPCFVLNATNRQAPRAMRHDMREVPSGIETASLTEPPAWQSFMAATVVGFAMALVGSQAALANPELLPSAEKLSQEERIVAEKIAKPQSTEERVSKEMVDMLAMTR